MKLFTVYPLIHDIVNSNLSRVQEIMGASEKKDFDEIGEELNRLFHVEQGVFQRVEQ